MIARQWLMGRGRYKYGDEGGVRELEGGINKKNPYDIIIISNKE